MGGEKKVMSRMDKQYKFTLALVLTFAVLATGYFMYQKFSAKDNESDNEKKINFLTIKKEDLKEVDVRTSNNDFTFVKEAEGFKYKQDKSLALDEEFMSSFIDTSTIIDAKKLIAQDISQFTDYGLAVPKITVTLTLADKSVRKIEIGDKSPTGTGYYAKFKDAKSVYLLDTTIVDKFNLGKDKFRTKKVFTEKMEEIEYVRFSKNGKIVFEAEADNKSGSKWSVKRPVQVRANDTVIGDVLSQALSLQVKEFLTIEESEKEKYGMNKPEFELTLREKGKKPVKVLFGKNKENEGKYIMKEGATEVLYIEGVDFPFLSKTVEDIKWTEEKK